MPRVLAAALPVLLVGAVGAGALVPDVRALVVHPTAWAAAVPAATQPAAPVSAGWGVSVWPPRNGLPLVSADPPVQRERDGAGSYAPPGRPAPPPRPALPWRGTSRLGEGTPTPPLPPVVLGPVQRLQVTVADGASVPLPTGTGIAHLLCAGPTTPGVTYVLDRGWVRRYDGGGRFDVYYRYVSRSYQQTDRCS